ncbi:MAG: hypothetical protein ACYC6B_07510 [Thermoleophilia bacterium]
MKSGKKLRSEKYLSLDKLKQVFAKGILMSFGLSIICLLTSFIQRDESVRQGLFFISALSGISALYLVALWSLPRNDGEASDLEQEQTQSIESVQRDWQYSGANKYSTMSAQELWKARRTLIITGCLFLPFSNFLTYFLLKAMGATTNEASVFFTIFFIGGIYSWVWQMGKYGLRKNQLNRTLGTVGKRGK